MGDWDILARVLNGAPGWRWVWLALLTLVMPACARGAASAELRPIEYRHGADHEWSAAPDVAAVSGAGSSNELWLRVRLPEQLPPEPTLFVPQVHVEFDAWVGDELIGSDHGVGSGGRAFHLLRLSPQHAGQYVRLHIRSTYSKTGLRGELKLGSRSGHLERLFAEDAPRLAAILALTLFGFGALLLAAGSRQPRPLLAFAAFALCVAVWNSFYTRVRDVYLPAPQLWLWAWAVSLAWAGSAFVWFFNSLFARGEKLLIWLLRVNLVSSVVATFIIVLEPPSWVTNPFLSAHRLLLGAGIVIAIWTLAQRVRLGDRDALIYSVGMFVLLALALHDITVSLDWVEGAGQTLAHFGHLALLLASAWVVQRRFVNTRDTAEQLAHELSLAARERELMLRELHDGMGRVTTGVSLLAEAARRSDDADVHLQRIGELAQEGADEVRAFVRGLDPEAGDWHALAGAMQHQAERWLEPRGLEVRLTLEVGDGAPAPTPYVFVQCLRVFQEGLTNALKHARPDELVLLLRVTPQRVLLRLENDGVAAKPETSQVEHGVGVGAGVMNMQKRAKELGGELSLEVGADRAVMTLHIPLPLRL